MPVLTQRSFSSGEIAPSLVGRIDHAKRQSGLALCKNWIPERFGSVANRPGTVYVGNTRNNAQATRLIPFVRDAATVYLLELGHQVLRIWKNDALVTVNTATAFSSVTAYVPGDYATKSGITYYCFLQNTNIDPELSLSSPFYWRAIFGGIVEIPIPYLSTELAGLQFVHSVDVMTITHPSYPPQELKRYSDSRWAISAPVYGPTAAAPSSSLTASSGRGGGSAITNPTGVTATGGNAALTKDNYVVTAWYGIPPYLLTQSPVSAVAQSTVGGADAANPVTISWTACATSASGMTLVEYRVFKLIGGSYLLIKVVSSGATSMSDNGIGAVSPSVLAPGASPSSITFDYVVTSISDADGSESVASVDTSCVGLDPTAGAPNLISWIGVTGVTEYNLYRSWNGVFGFIGTARGSGVLQFHDPTQAGSVGSIVPDTTIRPPQNIDTFASTGNYPAACMYFQQRLVVAATNNKPEWTWMSEVGAFHCFTLQTPITNDAPVSFELNGLLANPVRWLLDLGQMIIFTAQGVYTLDGNGQGAVTPTAINARRVNAIGASAAVRPLVINNSALYLQSIGNIVRDMRFDLQTQGYTGDEVSLWGAHLLQGHTVAAWDYAEVPHSIVWAAREDGKLLGCTYLPRESLVGWHQHDVGGFVEDVCVIPGSLESTVYLLVRRTINGSTVRYIEKMASRLINSVATDAHFVDCGVVALPFVSSPYAPWTLTLNGGTTWAAGESLTLNCSAAIFRDAGSFDVGVTLWLRFGTKLIRVLITGSSLVTPRSFVVVQLLDDVPAANRSVATSTWQKSTDPLTPVSTVDMSHLVGQSVIALADGNVVGPFVVPGGGVVNLGLATPAQVVRIGLPITADLSPLDLDDPTPGKTLMTRTRTVQKVTLLLDATRGIKVGENAATLAEYLARDAGTALDTANGTITGAQDVYPANSWSRNGPLLIRQDQPLPARILAIAQTVKFGDE